jgi:hypothetical protein
MGDTTEDSREGSQFVWEGTAAVNCQDPTWLTKLIG